MWDQRYSQQGYAYGVAPNSFLAEVANKIPTGFVLSLGEGEGRNATFLASLGHQVVAVDQSEIGLSKARQLAASQNLTIETIAADLKSFAIEPNSWQGIVSIFCHLPASIRTPLYAAAVRGLKPGGIFILEAYTPKQLEKNTGGPKDPHLLASLAELTAELSGLTLLHAQELEREVVEGDYHTGIASVVQIVGKRQ